jgi:hypothetical protein
MRTVIAFFQLCVFGSSRLIQIQKEAGNEISSDASSNIIPVTGCKELFVAWVDMNHDPRNAPSAVNCCDFYGIVCDGNEITKILWSNFQTAFGYPLRGKIPSSLLRAANHIDISLNEISSFEEPTSYYTYPKATVLLASNNSLSELPTFSMVKYGRTAAFIYLDLSSNLISNTLNTTSLSLLGSFEYLNFAYNSISGTLEGDFSTTWISLENNKLTGLGDLSKIQALSYMNIANNNIGTKFINPRISPGYPKLKECLVKGNKDLCYDDKTDILPVACKGKIPQCSDRNREPWEVCRIGIDECKRYSITLFSGYMCCVGIDDVATGTTTCRWKGAIGQAHGCVSE